MRSPYDGLSRRPLVVGLAVTATFDLVLALWAIGEQRRGWLAWAVPVALVGAAALVEHARRRAPIASGLVALGALALLVGADAALFGGSRRFFFASGAALFGWVAGLLWARLLGRRDGEPFAEAGAQAALAATYFNAGLGKLVQSGFAWADAQTLRAMIVATRPADGAGVLADCARLVVEHPGVARALAAATVVIQLGAVLWLLGPRTRAVWGALLLGFHLSVFLLVGIPYVQQATLVALWSWPWPRLAGARRAIAVEEPADAARERRLAWRAAVVVATAIALAFGARLLVRR